jgi:hypothetical protein
MTAPERRSLSQFFTNWSTYDAPVLTKLRLLGRNLWLRAWHRNACCGNHGQPGC